MSTASHSIAKCPICGTSFRMYRRGQITCGDIDCQAARRRITARAYEADQANRRTEVECIRCGKPYSIAKRSLRMGTPHICPACRARKNWEQDAPLAPLNGRKCRVCGEPLRGGAWFFCDEHFRQATEDELEFAGGEVSVCGGGSRR